MEYRRTKGGKYDFGGPIVGDTCLIHILTFDAAFSTKTAEPGNWGA